MVNNMLRTVMIIDDDPQVCTFLGRLLKNWNVPFVLVYKDFTEFNIETVFRNNDISHVIADIILPDSDGLELIQFLKKIEEDLKIMAISGGGYQSSEIYGNAALLLGCDTFIEKPIDISKVKDFLFSRS